MNRQFSYWIQGLALTCLPLTVCAGVQDPAAGFIEDSTWDLLNRTVHDRRAYRNGGLNGAAKGLVISARHATHRGNTDQAELDADQLRLAVEYPLKGML